MVKTMIRTQAGAWRALAMRAQEEKGNTGLCLLAGILRAKKRIEERHLMAIFREIDKLPPCSTWSAYKWDFSEAGRKARVEWAVNMARKATAERPKWKARKRCPKT